METERVQFEDGNWWDIRAIVTRRMRKAFRKAALRVVGGGLAMSNGLDLTDPEALRTHLIGHASALELDVVDDAFLLEGTVAWSWDTPVTLEAVDALPEANVNLGLARLRLLYAEADQEARIRANQIYDEAAKKACAAADLALAALQRVR